MTSHASIPVVEKADEKILRIYFGTRNRENRSLTSYIEVESNNPRNILYIHNQPILTLGNLGTFDDSGIMPSWIVNHNGHKYLYYIGWNPQVTVSYRLAIGLAIAQEKSQVFKKYSIGPICDRSLEEPYFNTAPCVLVEGELWRMWYISCTSWEVVNGWPEPSYHVKYAESTDGIHWQKTGIVCIDYTNKMQAIGRPCVYKDEGKYKMFFSYRGINSYRSDQKQSYRIGYAESTDGMNWAVMNEHVGIDVSSAGWDSEMIEYCYILNQIGKTYLFYNGNGFGKTGFGYAILDE